MSLADRQALNALQQDVAFDKNVAYLTAAVSLTIREQVVRVTANTASDDWTLTLPSVAEAAGLLFSIVSTIANAKTVTVADAGDDADFSNLTLDTDDDYAVLWSDGLRWYVLTDGIA